MKLRVPLYARILGLFLLNILPIAAAFLEVFRMQFHPGLYSFLAGQANQWVRALSDVVMRELHETPTDEMDSVVSRFTESFGVDLYVFRLNGEQVAGTPTVLPPEVNRLIRRQGLRRGGGGLPGGGLGLQRGPRFGQQSPAGPNAAEGQPPAPDGLQDPVQDPPPDSFSGSPVRRGDIDGSGGFGPGPRWSQAAGQLARPRSFFVKSTAPTRYWAGTFFPSRQPGSVGQPHVLLIASDSITGGGLFFDFTLGGRRLWRAPAFGPDLAAVCSKHHTFLGADDTHHRGNQRGTV